MAHALAWIWAFFTCDYDCREHTALERYLLALGYEIG